MAEVEIKRYQIPTHLLVPDKLSILIFSFTFRQLGILVGGIGAAYDLWQQHPFTAAWFTVVKWCGVGLILALALALAFVHKGGHTLDTWCFFWLRYHLQPTCYLWQRLPDPALTDLSPSATAKRAVPEEDR